MPEEEKSFRVKFDPEIMNLLRRRVGQTEEKKVDGATSAKNNYNGPPLKRERLSNLPVRLQGLIKQATTLYEQRRINGKTNSEAMHKLYAIHEDLNQILKRPEDAPIPSDKLADLEKRLEEVEKTLTSSGEKTKI